MSFAIRREIRSLLKDLRSSVEARFRLEKADSDEHHRKEVAKTRTTCVSAFVFLRFFVPAILNPRLFDLIPGCSCDGPTHRTLTLIAKTLQGLANMTDFGNKEPWMSVMNPFLLSNASSFQDFIAILCEPGHHNRRSMDVEGSLQISTVQRQLEALPKISQEGVPTLAHSIDATLELAALSDTISALPVSETVNLPMDGHAARLVAACRASSKQVSHIKRSLELRGEIPVAQQRSTVFARHEVPAAMSGRAVKQRGRGATISRLEFLPGVGGRRGVLARAGAGAGAGAEAGAVDGGASGRESSFSSTTTTASESSEDIASAVVDDEEAALSITKDKGKTKTKRRSYTIMASSSQRLL